MQNTATNPYSVPVSAYMQANNRSTHYLEFWKTVQMEAATCTAHNEKFNYYLLYLGTAVAQWLRCCATNRKVAGSILAGVSGFFIDIKSFRSHYDSGVDSASNRNEYQEYFLGVKATGA